VLKRRDNLRATTGTVEVPTKTDDDALALGARPIQQHEPAARHNATSSFAAFDAQTLQSDLRHFSRL